MSNADLEYESIPGLPSDLPPGEEIVWQGRPEWRGVAKHAYKLRWIALYFGVLVAARVVMAVSNDQGASGWLEVLAMLGVFGAGLGLLALMAWLQARVTVYTITTHRVVMRIGVALSVDWNLPFKRLVSADLDRRSEDDGDIVLKLAAPDRIRWVLFWPHVRATGFLKPNATLRALAEPDRVAKLLGDAVTAWAAEHGEVKVTRQVPSAPTLAPSGDLVPEAGR